MKTIAVISQKGGSGKTTIALHLAAAAALAGESAGIVDLDPQASAANWADRREADLPVVISAQASRLRKELDRARTAGGTFMLVDTAPHSDAAAIEAARAADLVIIPCQPSILDLEAITNTRTLIDVAKKPAVVVLNAAANANDTTAAIELLQSLDAEICPVQLGNRVAFRRALIAGQTAQEYEPNGKAAAEAQSLYTFTCSRVHA